jgi:tRNA nucleotidyltransferase (CCA-adding enzyme)
MLKLLEAIDAFRKPERLDDFLTACKADAMGRSGFEKAPYPQSDIINTCYQAAAKADISDRVKAGAGGQEIQETLKKRRKKAIAAALE